MDHICSYFTSGILNNDIIAICTLRGLIIRDHLQTLFPDRMELLPSVIAGYEQSQQEYEGNPPTTQAEINTLCNAIQTSYVTQNQLVGTLLGVLNPESKASWSTVSSIFMAFCKTSVLLDIIAIHDGLLTLMQYIVHYVDLWGTTHQGKRECRMTRCRYTSS